MFRSVKFVYLIKNFLIILWESLVVKKYWMILWLNILFVLFFFCNLFFDNWDVLDVLFFIKSIEKYCEKIIYEI